MGLFNSASQGGGAGDMDIVESDEEYEKINEVLQDEIILSIRDIDNGLFNDEIYDDEKDSIATAILLMNFASTFAPHASEWNDLKNIIMKEGEFSDGSAKKLLINEIFLSSVINKDTGDTHYQFIPMKIKDELIDIKNLVEDKDDKRFLDAIVSSIEEVYEGSHTHEFPHIHAGSKSRKYKKTKRSSKKKKKKKKKKKSKKKSSKKSLSRLLGSIFSY
jgi:hypothetical protein